MLTCFADCLATGLFNAKNVGVVFGKSAFYLFILAFICQNSALFVNEFMQDFVSLICT